MRWATFDCYGTLIDWNAGIGDALERMFPDIPRATLLEDYHRIEPRIEANGALPYRQVLAECARAIASERGVAGVDADELPASLPEWPPFDEVAAALQRLRDDGVRLAILSNTDPDLLAASITRIGVEPDLTITVAEAGSYKPARGHWDAFFSASGATAEQHVHVAASLFHDIEPCAAMRLRAIWVNRLGERSDLPRAAEIPTLGTLPSVVAGL